MGLIRLTWFNDLHRGIRNLIRWAPIVWRDRDWDHYYIWEVLRFKLSNQAEYTASYGNHENSARDAERIRLAVRLIERHVSDWYRDEPVWYRDSVVDGTSLDYYFSKYPRVLRRVVAARPRIYSKQLDLKDRRRRAIEIAEENQARCKRLLFRLIETNIDNWWD